MPARYQVQTTHGYYPKGRWGHACLESDREEAIKRAKDLGKCRVKDRKTEEIIWSPTKGEQS